MMDTPAAMHWPLTAVNRTPRTSEMVARELADYILENDLREGTRLPGIAELQEKLGVGKVALREALRLLETRGMLRIRPGRLGGPVVHRPRAADLSEAVVLVLRSERASVGDFLRARQAVEPIITGLAAERITDEQIAILQSTVEVMASTDDLPSYSQENERFHSTIAAACGNVVLAVFVDSLKAAGDGVVAQVRYPTERWRAVALAHERIVDALKDRDGEQAALAMEEHLVDAANYWRKTHRHLYYAPLK